MIEGMMRTSHRQEPLRRGLDRISTVSAEKEVVVIRYSLYGTGMGYDKRTRRLPSGAASMKRRTKFLFRLAQDQKVRWRMGSTRSTKKA
jgi:hypothetical protein